MKKKKKNEHSIRLFQSYFTRDQHKFICECGFVAVAYNAEEAREMHVLVLHDRLKLLDKKERVVN